MGSCTGLQNLPSLPVMNKFRVLVALAIVVLATHSLPIDNANTEVAQRPEVAVHDIPDLTAQLADVPASKEHGPISAMDARAGAEDDAEEDMEIMDTVQSARRRRRRLGASKLYIRRRRRRNSSSHNHEDGRRRRWGWRWG